MEHNGFIYELDGFKNTPIKHKKVSGAGFSADAAKLIQTKWFADAGDDVNEYSVLALAPKAPPQPPTPKPANSKKRKK